MIKDFIRLSIPHENQSYLLMVSLLVNILALALPLAMLQIYDRIIPNQSFGTAGILLTSVLIAILLEAFLRFGRATCLSAINYRLEITSSDKLVNAIASMSGKQFKKNAKSHYLQQFNALRTVNNLKSGQSGIVIYDLPFALIFILLVAYIGGWLVLIPLVAFALMAYLLAYTNRQLQKNLLEQEQQEKQWLTMIFAFYSFIVNIKNSATAQVLINLFRMATCNRLSSQMNNERITNNFSDSVQLISQVSSMLIVLFGALMVLNNTLTVGGLVACSILTGRSIAPVTSLVSAMMRVFSAKHLLPEFEKLDAKHKTTTKSFQGFEKNIQAGIHKAIEIKPNALTIIINSTALQRENLKKSIDSSRYDDCLWLDDEPTLFSASILDNLTLHDSSKRVAARELLNEMNLLDYFNYLPNGINTMVGNQPIAKLPKGVEQILCLARVLLQKPKTLILFDSLNAAEAKSVKAIMNYLKSYTGTVVILSNSTLYLTKLATLVDMNEGVNDIHGK